jgi:hypothetical protein
VGKGYTDAVAEIKSPEFFENSGDLLLSDELILTIQQLTYNIDVTLLRFVSDIV